MYKLWSRDCSLWQVNNPQSASFLLRQARPYSNVASVHVIFIDDSSEKSDDKQELDAPKIDIL